MICYQMIATAKSPILLQKLLEEVGDIESYKESDQALLKEAIQIASCIAHNDNTRFFNFLRSTNYMFACLMLYNIEFMRKAQIERLRVGFKVSKINGDLVQNKLLLDDREDLIRCL